MLIAIIVVLVLVLVGAIAMYNGLVIARQRSVNAWAQIEVQLKRRYDLIPNLVETVKGYMAHEADTLERVIQARNQALNAKTIGERATAEAAVGAAVTGLFGLAEAYPELRASETMMTLQKELTGSEDKISFSRQYYNDATTSYNTKLETFPSSIFASAGGFKPRELFLVEDPAHREPVQVKF